ncbi:MAG: tetratricopeptide repeat protein, partial [Pseudomonadota bacterium]
MTQSDALFEQAENFLKQNKVQEAKDILEKLIQEDQQARFYSKLGTVNMIMGNREGGFEHFKKSFEIDPDHVPTLANLALFYSETGMYKKALAFIQKALKLDPAQSNNYSILALVLKHLNHPLEAIDTLLDMP